MKPVYVVTSGCYSDYSVDAIFSTRAKAQAFVKRFPDSDCNGISEWRLDMDIKVGLHMHYVLMLFDGTVESVRRDDSPGRYTIKESGTPTIWKRSTAPAYKGKGIQDALNMAVFATDEKHAIKIVNEHRTTMIATGKWKPAKETNQ